jgi:hypothetical protein
MESVYVPGGTFGMEKLPAPSACPTYFVVSSVLSVSATYALATGSFGSVVRTSKGGQPTQFSARPLMEPLPAESVFVDVQTNPNQYPVRRLGGSNRPSPGAPLPSLPSSMPAWTPKPPSNVDVCTHVPSPLGPQPPAGGVT